jgi:RNA polymerase sigma factor (sigma-70 family)
MRKQQSTDDAKELGEDLSTELRPAVLRTARYLVRKASLGSDLAEDLVQVALLKYHKLGTEKRRTIVNHKAYLTEIVRNEILNYLNRNAPATESFEAGAMLESTSNEQEIENRILVREIWNKLEGEDRRLFELLTFDYSAAELAYRLSISSEAARQRTHRLKAKLKVMLTESQKRVS